MTYIDNLEKKRKTDSEIIENLTEDTKKGKFHWYGNSTLLYTRRRIVKSSSKGETNVDTIFKLFEQEIEEEYPIPMNFSYEYEMDPIVTMDIYISKNGKKEIHCKRITGFQFKLSQLMAIALDDAEKNMKK
jgi:hypothetical protein